MLSSLTFTTLRANLTDNNLMIFFQKTGFDISCKPCFLEQIRKIFHMLYVDFFFFECATGKCDILFYLFIYLFLLEYFLHFFLSFFLYLFICLFVYDIRGTFSMP